MSSSLVCGSSAAWSWVSRTHAMPKASLRPYALSTGRRQVPWPTPSEVVRRYLVALVKTAGPYRLPGVLVDATAFEQPTHCEPPRALEISTVVPLHDTILRWWHEEGGDAVTFGSDAHDPSAVARRRPWPRPMGSDPVATCSTSGHDRTDHGRGVHSETVVDQRSHTSQTTSPSASACCGCDGTRASPAPERWRVP